MRDYQAEIKKYRAAYGLIAMVALAYTLGLASAAFAIYSDSREYEINRLDNGTKILKSGEAYDPGPFIATFAVGMKVGVVVTGIFIVLYLITDLREYICASCRHHRKRHFDKNDKPFDECQYPNCSCKEFE